MRFRRFHSGPFALALLVAGCADGAARSASLADGRGARGRTDAAAVAERGIGLYRLKPAQHLARTGFDVRRVYFISDHLSDIGALSFERKGGASQVTFRSARRVGRELKAELPAGAWAEVDERSRRVLERRPASEGPCLDTWHFVVESADAHPAAASAPRRAATDTCSSSEEILQMAEIAADALQPCRMLEPRDDAIERLGRCSRLQGELAPAAAVSNLLHVSGGWGGAGEDATSLMTHATELDWQGRRTVGAAAAKAWSAHLQRLQPADFNIERLVGTGRTTVEVVGHIARTAYAGIDDDRGRDLRADVRILWSKDRHGSFRIDAISVGEFREAAGPN